jgi:hypothetical protein
MFLLPALQPDNEKEKQDSLHGFAESLFYAPERKKFQKKG